jgi:dihydrofolate reductase
MRKIIYGAGTSLDGYIARLDGSLDFLHLRPSNYSMGPFFKTIDVALMGRKTYEVGVRMSGGKFESHGLRCYIFSRLYRRGNATGLFLCAKSPRGLWKSCEIRRGRIFGWQAVGN